ncbi:AAA domain-containing protein [Actinocrispum sp. NPDC049592]|uniref:DEAD/DEAH box helicase n=1 Tax=Actinocrispum sp. NPDC049592 TaxID=3154835 RepID=UPI00342A0A0E
MPVTPPDDWADQLRTLPIGELVLSYNPRTLTLPDRRPLREVENDLLAGAWLTRDRFRRDQFRLGGTEFELRVQNRPGNTTGELFANVLNIDESRSVPRHGRILPSAVSFEILRRHQAESPCDLGEIERALRERERRLNNNGHRRRQEQTELRSHGQLQRSVLREYGELETLVAVLEQRPEKKTEDTISGIVLPERGRRRNGRPCIVVESSSGDVSLFRNKRVQLVRGDDQRYNTSVASARGDRLEIVEPRGWVLEAGEEVSVSIVRPFGMRQNADALTKFRAGEIEGSWDDLARLLCQPQDLVLPASSAPPLVFYCDDDPGSPVLNEEQRKAVTGAVRSPHAFVIQGPPGTGKTEVICEVVRQLVGRGERVLLLAPTHVAVDEVLGRVGRKPGLRPLRITWSDDQVDEDIHAFLPANVGIELAGRIARPSDHGQVARWAREASTVQTRLAEFAELDVVLELGEVAIAAVRAAAQAGTGAAERLHTREVAAETEIAHLEAELAERLGERDDATTLADDATRAHADVRAEFGPGLVRLRDAGRELAASAQGVADARRDVQNADNALHAWSANHGARMRQAEETKAAAERTTAQVYQGTNQARQYLTDVQTGFHQALEQQTGLGRFAERLGLGKVARWRRTLVQAEQAATQWTAVLMEQQNRWRVAVSEHDRLARSGVQEKRTLQHTRESHATVRERAERRYRSVLREFESALAEIGASAALVTTDPELVRLAGQALYDFIDSVVSKRSARSTIWRPGPWFSGNVEEVVRSQVARLSDAATEQNRRAQGQTTAAERHDEAAARLDDAKIWAGAEIERFTAESDAAQRDLTRRRAELEAVIKRRDRLVGQLGVADPAAEQKRLQRRRHVLDWLPGLDARWRELVADRSDEQFAEDIKHSLIRATNLVCATTKGIVGWGSQIVRHTDYDTLIVDEASRVTESEFLIGAIKARRWVLVGDEHQLPPYVDQEDEHFLHALIALNRVDRGAAETMEDAVGHLAKIWEEDEKERRFRQRSVLEFARDLESSGQWLSIFRARFTETYQRFSQAKGGDGDNDQLLLRAMRRYLVQSLFERVVTSCREQLRQQLVWQRRMISPLARIVNEPIYDGQYKSPPDGDLAAAGVTPLVLPAIFERPATLLDTSHYEDAGESEAGHGFTNKREQDWIVEACRIFNNSLRSPITVSVLAFYQAQARALEGRLLAMKLPMLQWEVIDVIDRIQGQQSDLVMLSFTRASIDGFGPNYGQWLQDLRRLNVACTRARRALVLVGHGRTLRRLRATDQAKAFYANLFELFKTDDNFQLIRRFG